MSKKQLVTKQELAILEKKNQAVTTSRNVAEIFDKNHKHILRDIKNLECSKEFWKSNFVLSNYKDSRGKIQPEYIITKDGFTFLAMGFTGKKAAEFKELYISRFNEVDRIIQQKSTQEWQESRAIGKSYQKELNDTVQIFVEYATSQGSRNARMYYKHFASLVNKLLEIKDGQREYTDSRKLQAQTFLIELVKRTIEEEMAKGTPYKEIYKKCQISSNGLLSFMLPRSQAV